MYAYSVGASHNLCLSFDSVHFYIQYTGCAFLRILNLPGCVLLHMGVFSKLRMSKGYVADVPGVM